MIYSNELKINEDSNKEMKSKFSLKAKIIGGSVIAFVILVYPLSIKLDRVIDKHNATNAAIATYSQVTQNKLNAICAYDSDGDGNATCGIYSAEPNNKGSLLVQLVCDTSFFFNNECKPVGNVVIPKQY